MSDASYGEVTIHTPEEIARRAGSITIKTLQCSHSQPGPRDDHAGPRPAVTPGGSTLRRLWGMTDAQLESLLAVRKR